MMGKRVLSAVLALVLCLGLLPTMVSAADSDFEINENGVLTKYKGTGGDVSIPNSVTSIGNEAFFKCSSLTSVTIPNSVTSIGDYAFFKCSSLTSVTIPDSVTSIGVAAFRYCSSLKSVTIPNSVTSVGNYAFRDCSSLTSVTIPESVVSIGSYVFSECIYLRSAGPIGSGADYQFGWKNSIPDHAFSGCALRSVTIPDSVTRIGDSAFYGCSSLTSVTIPNSVTSIGREAFSYCSDLTSVTIQNGVTVIREYAFSDCISLTSVTIPNGVTSIGNGTFYDCSSLTSVTIPNGVTSIGAKTFNGCSSLTSVTIPNSVTAIREFAFYNCDSLTDVYYGGSKAQWNQVTRYYGNDQLTSATIHFSAHPGYNPNGAARPAVNYGTSSGTSKAKAGMKKVQFDAGADLYKNGKTRTTMNITWDWDLFSTNAIGYSKDLATAAVILSGNAYTQDLVYDTLNNLGFSNITQANYGMHGVFIDQVGYSIASTTQKIDGVKTNVVAIVCRGTGGTFFFSEEWQSNIRHMSAGFIVAAADVINGLNNYVSNPAFGLDTSLPTKYFITGHSRGAAVANLVGAHLSDAGEKRDVFVYTFACPTTSNDPNRQNYNNIKNFINVRDAVPALPGWLNGMVSGYNRYGLECSFDKSDVGSFDSWLSQLTGGSVSSDVDSVLKEHCIAVYAAYVMGADLFGPATRYKTKVISVHCPVDVSVYDQYGQLLGTITKNNPSDELFANGVFAVIDGDEKYLYAPSGYDLRLELAGTDAGTMTYSVEEIDTGTGETVNTQTFSNVALTDGKTMTSAVTGEAADTQLLVTENGEVSAMVDENGGETNAVLISFVTGLAKPIRDLAVAKGEAVGTLPEPSLEGYVFDGWYTDEDLTIPFAPDAVVSEPLTLYASYTETYAVYGLFTDVSYDGETLTATLSYDYNHSSTSLFAALYQDGKMLDIQSADIPSGAKTTTVNFAARDLYGSYTLKAFTLDGTGNCVPVSTGAKVSFFAN